MNIAEAHLVIIRRVLQQYLPSEAKVWVFGSRAKNTAKKFSDLDLAIDIGQPISLNLRGELNTAFEESSLPYRVDLVDWHTVSADFKAMVEQDCVLL